MNKVRRLQSGTLGIAAAVGLVLANAALADQLQFTAGDLVVSAEGAGASGVTGIGDNQAAPLSLYEFALTGTSAATVAGTLVLPTTASGTNSAISGEYGSSSEGNLELSGNGQYLTLMGYGVNYAAFNANPTSFGGPAHNTALGQSSSLTGQGYTAVPRVVALIGATGAVDTSTAIYNIYDTNNPRSAFTVDGSSFYLSGQGSGTDATGGIFYAQRGANSAISITGTESTKKGVAIAQDTRYVTMYNGQLYASMDSKEGSNDNRGFIGTLGTPGSPPTTAPGATGLAPTQLGGFGTNQSGTLAITVAQGNGLITANGPVQLSPENFFFANPTTLYVADSGNPKSGGVGNGGLQKWTMVGNNTWQLDYTLSANLNLVSYTAGAGTTGLIGLTGQVFGNQVELFATNATVGDTDQTYLFGITDSLAATTAPSGESFTTLATAPADTNFRGVAFAPVPLPAGAPLFVGGLALLGWTLLRRKSGALIA